MIKIKSHQIQDNINIMQLDNKQMPFSLLNHQRNHISQEQKGHHLPNQPKIQDIQIVPQPSQFKSKRFKKCLRKQRTPSQILKDNILKNKQMKRVSSLRIITQDNLKMFMRLQEQKSTYNLNQLHRQLSCSVLPLSKSKISSHQMPTQQNSLSKDQESRCFSTTNLLKVKCQQMKSNFKQSRSKSKLNILLSEQSSQILTSRTTSKISIFNERVPQNNQKMNKQSIIQISQGKEQQIILKKIGIKMPNNNKQNIKSSYRDQNISNKFLSVKIRPQSSIGMRGLGLLTERKLNQNVGN